MAFEKRDMSGAMFRNDKGDNESRPDMRGYVVIEGKEWELAGWSKHSDNAGKWLSLSASEPRQKNQETSDDEPF